MPRARVLIVDDNADTALTTSLLIEDLGHEAEVATDPYAALTIARRFRPNIVVLDLSLPGMDGFQLAAYLRAEPGLPQDLRLIALTGTGAPDSRNRALEAGFEHYLVKPLDPRFFESLLGRAK